MPNPRVEDLFGLNDHADDDDANLSADDEQDESRPGTTGASRRSKRRKVTHSSSGSEGDDDDGNALESDVNNDKDDDKDKKKKQSKKKPDDDGTLLTTPTCLQPLTPAQLAQSRLVTKRTGIIYLSRIPPFMRPQKVKSLLSHFGTINRIFLSPEPPSSRTLRIKHGGNKKTLYEEGWVEFQDKKVARLVAQTLNATTIGGKKGSYYHDDVWNIKYLSKFKWHHLTAQIVQENAQRQSRLRAEIAQARRENKAYVRNVERAKMIENMKKKRKAGDNDSAAAISAEGAGIGDAVAVEAVEVRRQFRQNKIKGAKAAREEGVSSSEVVKKALGKLF